MPPVREESTRSCWFAPRLAALWMVAGGVSKYSLCFRGACVPGDTSESGLLAAGPIEVDAGITWLAAFPAIAVWGCVEGLRVEGFGSGGMVSIEGSIAEEVGG